MKISRSIFLAGLGIVAATLAAYHNTFAVPFIFDDVPSILYNPSITQLWPLSKPLSPPASFGFTVSGRPLLNLSLALNHAISGTNVWSYHVFNLAIHTLAGLALFGIARRTLLRPVVSEKLREQALPAALVIALLWTLHPIQTESVTYTIQRAESLMGFFFLLTLYCFCRTVDGSRLDGISTDGGARKWQAMSVVACALGMFCKEVMAVAPVMVFLYDRTFVAGGFRAAWRSRRWFYVALALTWLPLAWLVVQTGGNRGGTFTLTFAACVEFWLTQFVAVTRYLRLALYPSSLAFQYGVFRVHHLGEIFPQLLVILTLLAATAWALWRRPVLGFLGAWFFLILAPSSLAPGITQITVEHRVYLSLAAIAALVVGAAVTWFGRRGALALMVVAVVAGGLAERRNRIYGDDFTLWQDTVQKNPDASKALSNLGTVYYRSGDYARALALYTKSMSIGPESQTDFNIGLALDKMGRIDEAIPHYEAAVRALPYFAQAHAMLGAALARQGKLTEAMDHLTTALHYNPDMAETHYRLGLVMAELGRPAEALGCHEAALRLQPDFADPECGIGTVLYRLGHLPEARQHLERALKLNPNLADAHYNLGLVLAATREEEAAGAHYAEAIRLNPALAEARLNLGVMLAQGGRNEAALAQLEEAVRLKPALAEAQGNLGIVLAELGRPAEAVAHYDEALRLRPDYSVMHYNLGNALLRLQRWEEARKHFTEAVRLTPDFAPAKEMLERLQTLPSSP